MRVVATILILLGTVVAVLSVMNSLSVRSQLSSLKFVEVRDIVRIDREQGRGSQSHKTYLIPVVEAVSANGSMSLGSGGAGHLDDKIQFRWGRVGSESAAQQILGKTCFVNTSYRGEWQRSSSHVKGTTIAIILAFGLTFAGLLKASKGFDLHPFLQLLNSLRSPWPAFSIALLLTALLSVAVVEVVTSQMVESESMYAATAHAFLVISVVSCVAHASVFCWFVVRA